MNILSLTNVTKAYKENIAVDEISFDIPQGIIFGMLGPNGAGKTTLIRIITSILRADSGNIIFNGSPLRERHQEEIGYMPEERGLYKKMKVGDQLIYLGRLKGLSQKKAKSQIEMWFERLEIADWWNKKIEELSKGMQQKIQFIATVLHNPKILILDEPFSGLDPVNTELIKKEIYQLKEKGTSIIFSTHRMEQVEEICEEIILINNGKKVLQGKVTDIKEQYKEHEFELIGNNISEDLIKKYVVQTLSENKFVIKRDMLGAPEIVKELVGEGVNVHSFHEILPSLNEIFIKAVEKDTDE